MSGFEGARGGGAGRGGGGGKTPAGGTSNAAGRGACGGNGGGAWLTTDGGAVSRTGASEGGGCLVSSARVGPDSGSAARPALDSADAAGAAAHSATCPSNSVTRRFKPLMLTKATISNTGTASTARPNRTSIPSTLFPLIGALSLLIRNESCRNDRINSSPPLPAPMTGGKRKALKFVECHLYGKRQRCRWRDAGAASAKHCQFATELAASTVISVPR